MDWAILSEACMKTTRRRMSEGFVGQCLARRLTLAFGVGKEGWDMATLGLEVVKLVRIPEMRPGIMWTCTVRAATIRSIVSE